MWTPRAAAVMAPMVPVSMHMRWLAVLLICNTQHRCNHGGFGRWHMVITSMITLGDDLAFESSTWRATAWHASPAQSEHTVSYQKLLIKGV